jgi:capsular exopolysaccharide synthesis family protein
MAESVPATEGETARIGPDAEVAVYTDPRGIFADRLRFLRAHLRSLWSEEKLKTLLVASPAPHDGKSTVALNLAVMLAEKGKHRVLLIEADLHHPTVTRRLHLNRPSKIGLADCLEEQVDPFAAIRKIEPIQVFLLSAGKTAQHPTELLQSDAMPGLMRSLRQAFDWVIVDSPPVQPLSDALLLRQRTDATLLVVRSGCTRGPEVDEAVELLGKKNILGMVLNGVEGLERAYSNYYGSYGSNGNGSK